MPAHNLISTSHALLQFIIYKWFKQEIQKSCKKINYIKKKLPVFGKSKWDHTA